MVSKKYHKPPTPQGLTGAAKKIIKVIKKGFYEFPENSRFNGSGAPGMYLEHLLGLDANNKDQPDLDGWEVKYHSGTAPLTLFHKTPEPKAIMEYMVNKHGWKNNKDQTAFRHTIWGESERGFVVSNDGERIIVQHNSIDGPVPNWTHDTLINAMISKLRRLILVEGETSHTPKKGVKYKHARALWEISPSGFISAIERGTVAIDFDARTMQGAGTRLRDHGTKFRVRVEDLPVLYQNTFRLI
ncbi:MAG: MvaI/BcnI family restriction endonuclease [Ekhidna sp.]|nr:MvaI/BcnI family restriction endonuclease [Ekhidna sp.]